MENKFIENYLEWIKKNVFVTKLGKDKWVIETPFLDRHNDYLEIYIIKKENGLYILTDDGFTFSDLKASGFELSSPKRRELFELALIGLGVNFNEKTKELYVETDFTEIGKSKHKLVQAMLSVDDMFVMAGPTVSTLFKEDVKIYFRRSGIPFNHDIRVVGRSTYEHNIEIAIPSVKEKPETFIKVINNPIKQSAEHAIFVLNDIKEFRENMRGMVIFNDGQNIGKGFKEALNAYKIPTIAWSEREKYTNEFLIQFEK
jgi:hypothetical protein